MKVAHIIIGLTLGGAEKVVVDLCVKSKESTDPQFYVISLTEDMDRKPDLDTINIPVFSLGITKNGFRLAKGVRRLRKFLKREKIELIHAHMFHAYFIAIIASFGTSIPIVFTGHSTNIGGKIREYITWATKSLRKYDIIFSKDQRKFFHKKDLRTAIIPNGIDFNRFRKLQINIQKDNPFTFLNVGNLEEEKNQLKLIEIAHKLKDKGRNFRIKIVGEGSKLPELKKSIDENEVHDYVQLLGKRKDVPELMASSHCYILPSLWEGMPITILEAGATGIPIIATPVGNIPDLLNENRGYLTEVNEFPIRMEYVMDHYMESVQISERLSEYIMTQFSLNHIFEKHLELYQKAINQ